MYNSNGRIMRLLSHPVIFAFMAIVSVLPHGHWGVVGLLLVEAIVFWGTLPDMRSAKRAVGLWAQRKIVRPYWVPFWHG